MTEQKKVAPKKNKIIALYFPQFHAIPENDSWWGKGFTDWKNVKRAKPLFKGHYQPRTPLNKYYYDQSKIETLKKQIELAVQYGIYGFCHYHYWFNGKQLLETPTTLFLENKEWKLPFCLSWANETWSKRWDGRNHHILIKQTHPPTKESWNNHFKYLINAWTDDRAIKINGKSVFVIYRPHYIPEIDNMLDFWRNKALEYGLDGLYFIAQKQYEFPSKDCLKNFDAIFQFQPFETIYAPTFNKNSIKNSRFFKLVRALPESVQERLRSIHTTIIKEPTFYDYNAVWEQLILAEPEKGYTTYPGAFVDWDNTARYKQRATIFLGASPDKFKYWLSKLVDTMASRALPENLIFLNAWNEWSESAYLEPDSIHQYKYLEAVRQVIKPEQTSSQPQNNEHYNRQSLSEMSIHG